MHILFLTIYQPVYNALVALYNLLGDFGVALVALTILVKLVMLPLSRKQIQSQKEMMDVQPKLKELQKKYKNDKEKLSRETLALYKKHHINPAAGCLPLIVQMTLLITLYRVIMNSSYNHTIAVDPNHLYAFVSFPQTIDPLFLNVMRLAEPSIVLAVITAAAQFYQMKMMQPKVSSTDTTAKNAKGTKNNGAEDLPDFASILQKQMLFIVPIMTLFIGMKFPSGLTLYWFASTVFMIAQQWWTMRDHAHENT